ncbi:phosphatidate cytidylyltransferase [Aeoliella sp. ICT_H6.2]|uniref:Phosphatidate cytidylyltransferase n=1 Tax=Aeoliella straminimaris TaxID=2954799 RepID=A0A9X2FGA1_9BACT|nr:phosphatidate cytidylyltransferase [Aeoliella straminimaris]MCO6047557.1 phosphatidate cytidylyltransferase [Aeoliella straminimaris]
MDPLFLRYCWILGGCLLAAAGGIVLARFAGRDVSRVWPTYRSWLVIIPLALATIYLGPIAVTVGFAALSLAGGYEYARATGLATQRGLMVAVGLLVILTYALVLFSTAVRPDLAWSLFAAMPVCAVVVLFAVPVVRNKSVGQFSFVAQALVGYLLVGWMLAHTAWIAPSPYATGLLLFLLFTVETSDIAAFTFGSLLGRHPLCPTVSPKKTWEGAIGALIVALALPWLLRFSFPSHIHWYQLLMIGLAVGVGGQLGDLSVSLIKRSVGVKDMGNSIPGHGGVLDRIDSLLFAAPLFYYSLGTFAGP